MSAQGQPRSGLRQVGRTVALWVLPPLIIVIILGVVVGSALAGDYRQTEIPPRGHAAIDPPTVIVAADGQEVRQLEQAVVGAEVSADDLPDHVLRAILAAEDRRFWQHSGFSVRGIVRALVANLRQGQIVQGASTITQQYVSLTTPGQHHSYRDKAREVVAAWKYERHLGKREVLDRYLNVVPFGRDTTGVDAAARVYFGVPANELDVNQAAALAGIIAAPSAFDPARNPDGALHRRNFVLDGMQEEGWLDQDEAERISSDPLPASRDEPLVQPGDDAYFVDAVRRQLEKLYPDRDLSRGLRVTTTLDGRMQQVAQRAVHAHVASQPYSGAAVVIDPASGAVRALVGGSGFVDEQYNVAIQGRRQPGSAFKTFTLAAFIEEGWSPESTFPGPETIEVTTVEGPHEVRNFGGASFPELTVREATERSVNTVYMQLIEEIGADRVAEVAERMGLQGELPAVPSLTLGTASVSPLHMASAYATLAADGVYHEPYLIAEVTDADGEVIFSHTPSGERVVSEQVARTTTDVLEGVISRGTGRAADIGRPAAGKTGTTNDFRDAWFVGYTPQLATAVWVGMADNSPMPTGTTGGGAAAPIWAELMSEALAPLEPIPFPTLDGSDLETLDRVPRVVRDPSPEPSPTSESPSPTEATPTPTEPEPTEPEPTEPRPAPSPPGREPTEEPSDPPDDEDDDDGGD
jgi:penicillin-binding protein 1A